MQLDETINKFIRDTINLSVGTSGFAIREKQYGAPKPFFPPDGAFATVNMSFDQNVGWEQTTYENNDGDPDLTETVEGYRIITVSLNFYRKDSRDIARKYRTSLARESFRQLFTQANLGLLTRSEIRGISESLEDGWESRTQMDITLSAIGTDEEIVRSIESVDIMGEFQARELINNFNVEI
jgi:hypothetical protein